MDRKVPLQFSSSVTGNVLYLLRDGHLNVKANVTGTWKSDGHVLEKNVERIGPLLMLVKGDVCSGIFLLSWI